MNLIPYVFLIAAQAAGLVFIVRMYIEIRRLTKVERNLQDLEVENLNAHATH
jgi:hypothetical protein